MPVHMLWQYASDINSRVPKKLRKMNKYDFVDSYHDKELITEHTNIEQNYFAYNSFETKS